MESKFITIQDKRMHYKSYLEPNESNKPVCIFIHGANPASQHTEFWTPILPVILKHCQPIFLDGYGHGQSAKPSSREEINFNLHKNIYTEFITKIISDEKLSSCILIGRSLGGAITHTLAKTFENTLSSIGMIAPAGARMVPETLKDWTKNVSVLWDSEDPVVGFESYKIIESTLNQVKLFVVGADESIKCVRNQKRYTDLAPSHVPELQYPELFKEFLTSLT